APSPSPEDPSRRRHCCLHRPSRPPTIEHEAVLKRPRSVPGNRSGPKGPTQGKENGMAQYEAYCVKCKAKREFEGEETTLKNGRRAAKGKCPVCGITVMRSLSK